jgi:hypothetical protein
MNYCVIGFLIYILMGRCLYVVLFVADAKEIQSSDDHFQESAFIQSSGGICSDGNQHPING